MEDDFDIGLDWGDDIGLGLFPETKKGGFAPRKYQTEAADAVRAGWEKHDKQFIELATGCGKTVIFSGICNEYKLQGKKCLILAHRDELVDQAIDKIRKFYGINAGKEQSKNHGSLSDDVVCASIQTIAGRNRMKSWPEDHFDLVVVDECHRTLSPTYLKVLNYFYEGGAKILGVTATSDRGDKRNLGEFYEHCSYEYNLLNACKDGYLVAPTVIQIPIRIDLNGIRSKRTANGSDIDATELAKRISPLLDSISKEIVKEVPDRKTLIFMPSVETSQMMAQSLRDNGLNADYVSGACSDRHRKVERYIKGDIQYLCNAMLLTEGFDDDNIGCIVNLRPTKIRSLYTQIIGRGTRPLAGLIDGIDSREERLRLIKASSKPNLLILDLLWMTEKLDLVSPVDLVCGGCKDTRERMIKALDDNGDLLTLQVEAEKDMLASLEKNVKEHSQKRKRVINPLQFAVLTGDSEIGEWAATEPWHKAPMTQAQIDALTRAGIDPDAVGCKGLASRLIDRLMKRQNLGLATPKQLKIMAQFKHEGGEALTIVEATAVISKLFASKGGRKSRGK